MHTPRPRSVPPRLLRLPRRTARLRLTVLYGGAFLACGTAVLALTYLLDGHATHLAPLHGYSAPTGFSPPKAPSTLLPPPSRPGCAISRRNFSRRSPPTSKRC